MKPEHVRYLVPVNPIPWPRPGQGHHARFTPPGLSAFHDEFGWALKAAGCRRPPYDGDLDVAILVWRRCSSPTARGDVDNLEKAILDAGNRIAWADDRQIRRLTIDVVDAGPAVSGAVELTIKSYHPPIADLATPLDTGSASC